MRFLVSRKQGRTVYALEIDRRDVLRIRPKNGELMTIRDLNRKGLVSSRMGALSLLCHLIEQAEQAREPAK